MALVTSLQELFPLIIITFLGFQSNILIDVLLTYFYDCHKELNRYSYHYFNVINLLQIFRIIPFYIWIILIFLIIPW